MKSETYRKLEKLLKEIQKEEGIKAKEIRAYWNIVKGEPCIIIVSEE